MRSDVFKFSTLMIFGLLFVLTLGWWMTPSGLPKMVLCPSLFFFNVECPGCGMTRAFLHLARGHFAQAWQLNHASVPLYFFLWSVLGVETLSVLNPKKPLNRAYYRSVTPWLMAGILVLLAGGWVAKTFL